MKKDALLLALCLATAAFALAFVWPLFTPESVAWYLPLERRWTFAEHPAGLAMDFYGRTLQAAIAWCAVFVLAMLVGKRPRSKLLAVALGWALALTLFALLYFAWTLHGRPL